MVGGCYAADKLDALTDFSLGLTKRRVMGLIDLRLPGSGLIAGDRLRQRLIQELAGRRIESLPVAFASVATELGTGHEVWLGEGPLIDAVRASYAIPGIFPPVCLDGRLLMDGTLVNPVPVRLTRELGADLVVSVNLNCDPQPTRGAIIRHQAGVAEPAAETIDEPVKAPGRWSLLRGGARRNAADPGLAMPGIARVMLDAFNITQDRISRARLAAEPPDVAITPALETMGLFEFHRAAEGIALGRAAAQAALPQIRRMIEGAAARV